MTSNEPQEMQGSDPWADWLLWRRHGVDPSHEADVRGQVESFRNRVLDGAGPLAGMTLLDVGAGDGLISFGAFERAGGSLKAILADVSKTLLRRAEERSVELGLRDRCRFLHTSAERLDGVADASADILATRAVLAYVPDKAAAARQFHRVLKPGGRLSIAEPIYRDEALQLAAFENALRSGQARSIAPQVQLMHRCRAAQIPSTLEAIQKNPLTNFSERDLIPIFHTAGFSEIHLELHIDLLKQPAVAWDTFIDAAPLPGTPTLREVFAAQLSDAERRLLEQEFRLLVETGQNMAQNTTAYLTARKPAQSGMMQQ